ncbi:hypothetical protein GH714_006739 [Hevea brasiliensis]|uniref:SHSP domain-containing protein n=1 Tax=Hevea brasiliensis TaxID=3981 RepID=A0A6A6LHM4_HEVBR|nr:hypothetical protein GH714_006739 [Hevea brasiliensis]
MAHLNHVDEDFEPTTEWAKDAAFDTLFVYLPGFKKEQLRVQVTSARNLRIFGERPLADNISNRFRKELSIASNYDSNQITAKFEGGILKIKHPKINKQGTTPQENASAAGTPELQKSGRDQAAQQVPSKIKIDKETSRNNVDENAASQNTPDEEKGLRDASGKNSSSETVANNVQERLWRTKRVRA